MSNDENDPATANQATSTRQQRRKVSHGPQDDELNEARLNTIKAVIKDMLNIRGWTGSATVSALQARAASAGHDFSEALLIKVSASSSASQHSGRFSSSIKCEVYFRADPSRITGLGVCRYWTNLYVSTKDACGS